MSANQTKYPQLRFKGFTDPWEQRKLSDGTNKIGDGLHGTPKYSEDGEVYFVNGNNLVNGQIVIMPETKTVTSNEQSKDDKALNESTILMSINGTIGNLAWYRGENLMLGKSAAYIEVSDFDKKFIYAYLQTRPVKDYYLNSLTGTTIKNLGLKAIRNTNICTPTIDEQAKIGVLFQNLDKTITLHQRKLTKLKELKQGYLQKMFPKNGSKFPQLRFAGFADAWEERKLSSISERVTRKNKNNESTLPLTISAQDGLVDQNDFFNKQVASRDVTGYFLVKNGEFAYNKSYSNGYPWGAIKRLDKYDMGVLSTLYIVFRPTKINSQFLVSYYDTTRWYREVSKNAAEGARNHGLLNIAPTDFFNTLLVVPKIVDEQQKIGSFFKQLDDTIALHQRKLEKLQELKKGYLQKMFCWFLEPV